MHVKLKYHHSGINWRNSIPVILRNSIIIEFFSQSRVFDIYLEKVGELPAFLLVMNNIHSSFLRDIITAEVYVSKTDENTMIFYERNTTLEKASAESKARN